MSRLLWLCLLAVFPLTARAHVNSPTVIFEGLAGPYPVRVIIRPPGVVPGLAEINVRVQTNGVQKVEVLPVHFSVGLKGSPPPDVAKPVSGDTNLYNAQLWLMARGAYSVHVRVQGERGAGTVMVPVNSLALTRLPMPAGLGILLALLGMLLFCVAAAIVGAAVRESTLEPGLQPATKRRWLARAAVLAAALLIASALYGGRAWWNNNDRDYRNNRMHKPVRIQSAVRLEGAQRILRLSILDTNRSSVGWNPLVPDHGKLMHAFLVRDPDMDAFAHLHPARRGSHTFEAVLPALPDGNYVVYADVTHENGFSQTLTSLVKVPAAPHTAAPDESTMAPDESDSWHISAPHQTPASPESGKPISPLNDHLVMIWDRPDKLRTGQEVSLRFAVLDADGHPAQLEPYLGMSSHAAIRRDDGHVFIHLHPAGSISMASQQVFQLRAQEAPAKRITAEMMDKMCKAPTAQQMREAIVFPYEFPEPGSYRVWVQVKSNGAVLTGVFDTEVQ